MWHLGKVPQTAFLFSGTIGKALTMVLAISLLGCATTPRNAGAEDSDTVYFQSHRGAAGEAPENTLVAVRHDWSVVGAVPEVDLRTTADGAIVCVHDETLARTTDAHESLRDQPIATLSLDQVRQCDAGVKFSANFAGEKVPLLTEIFDDMKDHPARQLYLDVKAVDLAQVKALIESYGLGWQIIFVHGSQDRCVELLALLDGARTMTWLSGSPDEIRAKFAAMESSGFRGLSQLQLHLQIIYESGRKAFALDDAFLREAYEKTRRAGVALQLRPFQFDGPSLAKLMDIGIRWYVTDDPQRFADAVAKAREVRARQ